MSDYDPPEAFKEINRKARKPHRCFECNGTIPKGETYSYVSGVWDHQGCSFKICTDCAKIREDLLAHGNIEDWEYGDLIQEVSERIDEPEICAHELAMRFFENTLRRGATIHKSWLYHHWIWHPDAKKYPLLAAFLKTAKTDETIPRPFI